MTSETLTPAPEFSLPSTSGAPVALRDLHASGPLLLLFVSEECPTCVLTLRRLAPLVPDLRGAGLAVAAVFEDPLEVAARVARRTGFSGTVVSEPAPYDVSRDYGLQSLPTAVLVDPNGRQAGRVVGWDADGLESLLSIALDRHAPSVTGGPPRRKPGCAAKNTYDAESLRALDGTSFDELEDMFERGWTDGLPVLPPTRSRVEAMLGGRDPDEFLGEMAPLRLVVSLTGGGYPGRLDRSALGNPGKVGLCFAEDEEVSPWEPLHVSRGYERGQSVATVFGADAPLSISDHRSTEPLELARVLGEAAAATWSPNWWPLGGTSLFVICPEHARSFAEWGWSRQQVREAIFEAVRRPAASLRWGETTPLVGGAADDQPIGKWSSPEEIVLVVAGGEAGRFSAVFGPCLGMNAEVISKEVPWTT